MSHFERPYVGDQAGPGLVARVFTLYDDAVLYPRAYFHPTGGASKSNPDVKHFLLGAHLIVSTWVETNLERYVRIVAGKLSVLAPTPREQHARHRQPRDPARRGHYRVDPDL